MGFCAKWVGWAKWCIFTTSFSVLVNGTPAGFFNSSKGLRQGDPISPYLFVLGMEALSCLIKRAVSGGFLTSYRVKGRGGEGVQLTHLMYADDTLIFCDASKDQLAYLSCVLMWFEVISGLRINLDKSEIIPMGKVENLKVLALELEREVGKLPPIYLGLPLGAPHKSVAVWDGVEERLRRRLAFWKRQYISKGGRLTLIRSALSNMSIYYMSILCMPISIRLRLEQIQRDFLWSERALERKIHLVKWPVVCSDKSKGGLGVKSVSTFNRALLGKWSWRFMVENEVLWYRVISRKYGVEERGWYTWEGRKGFSVGLWKEIRKEGSQLNNYIGFSVGNRRRTRFWLDSWCGGEALCNSFPSLFTLAVFKEERGSEVWDSLIKGGSWSPRFLSAFND